MIVQSQQLVSLAGNSKSTAYISMPLQHETMKQLTPTVLPLIEEIQKLK